MKKQPYGYTQLENNYNLSVFIIYFTAFYLLNSVICEQSSLAWPHPAAKLLRVIATHFASEDNKEKKSFS